MQDAVIWGGGQLTSALTLTISPFGACGSKIITIPTNTLVYENIGTNNDGVAKERDTDGSPTWQNTSSHTFGASNATILPIELLFFNAVYNNTNVELNWATATELNNDFYTVERSDNGVDFISILTKKGAGNSVAQNVYSDKDNAPLSGISYYRLKQTDLDGSYTYSQIVSVENNRDINLSVYPNPTNNGIVNIRCSEKTGTLEIIDNMGQIVEKKELISVENQVDLNAYGKGVYLVLITSNNTLISKKIINN